MLILIDNFDSFTYNLAHAFQTLKTPVRVVRNHALSLEECLKLGPSHLVIGPGPGSPAQSGISKDLIRALAGKIPILGVCLGHQCLGELYGGSIVRAKKPMHGKRSPIIHDQKGVFLEMPPYFLATRYHSLIIERSTLPPCLEISAETDEGEIMGVRHREIPKLEGVQFHPESITTEAGMSLLQNFLQL